MLVRFRFGNFRCFKDNQELSLVAAKKSPQTISVERPRLDLLRAAAIFGANASGKTTVLQALRFVQTAVRFSFQAWPDHGDVPIERFAMATERPSTFEILFVAGGTLYEYRFELNSSKVVAERLEGSRGRRFLLFDRYLDERGESVFEFGSKLGGRNRIIAEVTRPNCLFLSAASAHKHEALNEVSRWFSGQLLSADNPDRFKRLAFTLSLSENSAQKERIVRLLQLADFAIKELKFRPVSSEKFGWGHGEKAEEPVFVHEVPEGLFELPIEAESEGSQAFFALIGPVLWALDQGKTLCVDELDSSLHPLLVREIVRLFQDPERNPKNAQLIFNTHDSSLLGNVPDPAPLSRDEVWFTERLPEGGSKLYPLSDFVPRGEDNLGRGYLLGRYGALPDLRLFQFEED
jgi:uncharacterized protein